MGPRRTAKTTHRRNLDLALKQLSTVIRNSHR